MLPHESLLVKTVSVDPVFYRPEIKERLEQNLMLFYTAIKRDAHEILKTQHMKTLEKRHVLAEMKSLVKPMSDIVSSGDDLSEFGRLLHRGWLLKKSITDEISSPEINQYYARAIKAGALGGSFWVPGAAGFCSFSSSLRSRRRSPERSRTFTACRSSLRMQGRGSRIMTRT